MSIPEHRMVPQPPRPGEHWIRGDCFGCDFRYMREVKCSQIDCRPRYGVPVIAKLVKE